MEVKIGQRLVGPGHPAFVIAEMSANHDQDLERALRLVDLAADCGVDALKVQTYRADTMTLDTDHPSARVDPIWGARNLFELYQRAFMPWEFHEPIFTRARKRGLIPFSSPFDDTAVDLLEDLGVEVYKVASFELVHFELLRRIARTGKPLIISTGMASLGEVEEALGVLQTAKSGPVIVLHCCSSYPAEPKSVNLAAIQTMQKAFGVPVGFSDHTVGSAIPIVAVALGACAIEKHFTDDTRREGPDHRFSADPQVMKDMVIGIRAAEVAVGTGRKAADPSEEVNRAVGRRSIFVRENVAAGAVIRQSDVTVVRPGSGLHPRYLPLVVGRVARRAIPRGSPVTWDDV